jgi:hypothetical protein
MRPGRPDDNGKIIQATSLTKEYPEEIEADLQRYYGIDFLDLFRKGSGLSWRKLLVFLRYLPPESALNTAIRNDTPVENLTGAAGDPEESTWSAIELLIALLIDEIRDLAWMYASTHSERPIARPEPIARPGIRRAPRRKVVSLSEARRVDPRLRSMSDEEAVEALRSVSRGR